ncbi:MAG: hypothetical protein ABSD69_02985 [Candidatus Levyibacteriota bacterium]|jgi:hypothetical protein
MVELSPQCPDAEICPHGQLSDDQEQWLVAPLGPNRELLERVPLTKGIALLMIDEATRTLTEKLDGKDTDDRKRAIIEGFLLMTKIFSSPTISPGNDGAMEQANAVDLLTTDPSGTKLFEAVISSREIPSDQRWGVRAAIGRFKEISDQMSFDPVI